MRLLRRDASSLLSEVSNMNERRSESRTDITWSLSAGSMTAAGKGTTINASLSGFLIKADLPLTIGELLLLRIDLSPVTSVDCLAQIVREETRVSDKLYGAEIRYIAAKDRQKLGFALMTTARAA